jgi:hypothetical protein
MEQIIEAIGLAFERIVNTVDSAKKLLVVVTLFFLVSSFYLVYRLSKSQELIASVVEPRIEYLTLPNLKAWGFFDLRADLLRQDFSNHSRGQFSQSVTCI